MSRRLCQLLNQWLFAANTKIIVIRSYKYDELGRTVIAFAAMTDNTPISTIRYDLLQDDDAHSLPASEKFSNPDVTENGAPRAKIALHGLDTLWINTGTLCNVECVNCYIKSSPTNDRLVYFSKRDARQLFDEIEHEKLGTQLIAFTGGEPFMNPEMIDMARDALARDLNVLILTNAMQPMQRPKIKQELLELSNDYGAQLALRVSLDHFSSILHDGERGPGAWDVTIAGLDWLTSHDFNISLAGRTCWNETPKGSRQGYANLFAERGYRLDAYDEAQLLLFPEMDESLDVAEITMQCFDLLNVNPRDIMCATSRMVVKRKGATQISVVPCTLLPYDEAFHMGTGLSEASLADSEMFDKGQVKLNHHYCSNFCVLGGGSCTSGSGDS